MKALIQRVLEASVRVNDRQVGQIGPGLLILLGVTHDDRPAEADRLAQRVAALRVFDDAQGVMNRSLVETGGAALVISQFTLYGDTRKGNRPSWAAAARPEQAEPLYNLFVTRLRALLGPDRVAVGQFGAEMKVSLINDGPVTVEIALP